MTGAKKNTDRITIAGDRKSRAALDSRFFICSRLRGLAVGRSRGVWFGTICHPEPAKRGEGSQDARLRLKPSVPAQVAQLEILRRPSASPPLRGLVPPAA